MGVNPPEDLVPGRLQLAGDGDLGDHFGNVVPDHMGAKEFPVFGVEYDLYKAFRGSGRRGLSTGEEGELADLNLITGVPGGLFGITNAGYFRTAIGVPGNIVVVHGLGLVGEFLLQVTNGLGRQDAFLGGYVGQRLAADTIPDGVDTGHRGLTIFIGDDFSLFCLDGVFFQADAFEVGDDADGAQHDVGFQGDYTGGRFDGCLHTRALGIDAGHLAGGHYGDALLLELFFQFLRHILVFKRYDPRQEFHEGHFRTDGIVEIGEFAADGSAADDDHALGLRLQGHRLAVFDDLCPVDGEVGQRAGAGAGGQDDVFSFYRLLLPVGSGHFHFTLGNDLGEAHDDVDLVLLHQELNALAHLIGYPAAAFDDGGKIGLRIGDGDAVVLAMLRVLE